MFGDESILSFCVRQVPATKQSPANLGDGMGALNLLVLCWSNLITPGDGGGHRQLHQRGLKQSVSSAFFWRESPQPIARVYSRGKKLSLLKKKASSSFLMTELF